MRRLLIAAVVTTAFVLTASPAAALPSNVLDVPVVCPSGSQTIGFIDNNGSVVGFDEAGQVVQVRRLQGEFALLVEVDNETVFEASDVFEFAKGNGNGLQRQFEECTFELTFFEGTETITEEFAAQFQADFGSDVLFEYVGQDAYIVSQLAGTASLKFPRR